MGHSSFHFVVETENLDGEERPPTTMTASPDEGTFLPQGKLTTVEKDVVLGAVCRESSHYRPENMFCTSHAHLDDGINFSHR